MKWQSTHTQCFYGPFSGTTRVSRSRRNLLMDFMVHGKISEVGTQTIWLGTTPSRLISDPPSHFYTRCPSCHNPPILSWLGTGTKYTGLHSQWLGYPCDKAVNTKTYRNIPLTQVTIFMTCYYDFIERTPDRWRYLWLCAWLCPHRLIVSYQLHITRCNQMQICINKKWSNDQQTVRQFCDIQNVLYIIIALTSDQQQFNTRQS